MDFGSGGEKWIRLEEWFHKKNDFYLPLHPLVIRLESQNVNNPNRLSKRYLGQISMTWDFCISILLITTCVKERTHLNLVFNFVFFFFWDTFLLHFLYDWFYFFLFPNKVVWQSIICFKGLMLFFRECIILFQAHLLFKRQWLFPGWKDGERWGVAWYINSLISICFAKFFLRKMPSGES